MSIRKSLGGDRLGSGKKMNVSLHGFERSSHDLGRLWRSTMSAGTLVPYMVEYALPGDVWNIDLDADVKTYPTVGPLFGSFKLQLDVFQAPIRLYNAELHNNKLGIGMNMNKVKLPQLDFQFTPDSKQNEPYKKPFHGKHINASSIHAYLGIRGFGSTLTSVGEVISAEFNAIPYIAYWDIYKNYYANKQEEIGMVIHAEPPFITEGMLQFADDLDVEFEANEIGNNGDLQTVMGVHTNKNLEWIYLTGEHLNESNIEILEYSAWVKVVNSQLVERWHYDLIDGFGIKFKRGTKGSDVYNIRVVTSDTETKVRLKKFDLSNIDDLRENILKHSGTSSFTIRSFTQEPYGLSMGEYSNIKHNGVDNLSTIASYYSQEGLGIKTYQSDIFNNWLSTEWIDGSNGINAITAIDTSDGSFKIDTLNLANKVYDMLNRIAVSGGSYDDWIEANWTHSSYRRTESPIYHGGLSKEVIFQEVVSNSATDIERPVGDRYSPLGSLAGKGGLANKNKGGKVTIKVHEPSVLIGIVSLTPRIDYSQGNEWHINLKTLDDFHKPGLDGIGFQELITEQMAEWDVIRSDQGIIRKSAGKQPAWINYQTSFNRTYGNFADPRREMYMTLNRRYEYDEIDGIKDLTTYIDPSKFNYLFADTNLNSQNFWVQIGMDITARRKMSAKVMPNL